ncbi:MAG: Txe/YoeB family addiction module toxin [Gemmatimonadales bacterium]
MAKIRKQLDSEENRARSKKLVRDCILDPNCLEDLQWWSKQNPRVCDRALKLIELVLREPFSGPGKPEPLKGLGPNTWSRRLTEEHRLVYIVFDDRINFLMARYHY